jgi:hypothetical protein
MDLRPADRAPEATPGAIPWPAPRPTEPARHHAGSLHGATLTGEAGRHHLSVRVGVWLDEAGAVRQARWRASDDPGLRSAAEAACALLEARGEGRPVGSGAPHDAGVPGERAEIVAAAIEAALRLAGGEPR